MPEKTKKPSMQKRPRTITFGQVRERSRNVHSQSEVWVTGRDVLGFPFRCRVVGIRLTMNDEGKRDYVEVLV